jgi:hypothetical protein
MSKDEQNEDSRRNDRPPKQRCADRIGLLFDTGALNLHTFIDQPQRTPGMIGFGQCRCPGIVKQRGNHQQPADRQDPTNRVHLAFWQLCKHESNSPDGLLFLG